MVSLAHGIWNAVPSYRIMSGRSLDGVFPVGDEHHFVFYPNRRVGIQAE
jgi:hypothetical protein